MAFVRLASARLDGRWLVTKQVTLKCLPDAEKVSKTKFEEMLFKTTEKIIPDEEFLGN